MEKFVIIINKERLYLAFNGVYYLSPDIFDEDVFSFNSLTETIEFIKNNADFISNFLAINDYKKKQGKVVLYPSKVVPMYNTHKAIEL